MSPVTGRFSSCGTERNLKPSNILLKQDLSFQVSDFQVHSMADDELKLKIRIKERFMKKYNDIEEAQISAMNYLLKADQDILEHSMEEEWMSSEKVISTVLDVVRTHSTNQELLALALNVLMILSGNEVSAGKIGKAGGIPELLKAMRTFIYNRDICMSCCGALWSLVLNGRNARIASAEGALLTVCSAGEVYLQDEVLMETVCSALWSLILQELAAFRVLLPPAGTNGLQVVAEVYRNHTDDTEVVENICSLFYEMVQYDEVVPELISFKEMIKQIQIKFASNKNSTNKNTPEYFVQ
ncbi:UNVERIFIED_CONTAM: hypothetical protein FKN15_058039 [Acipenser sinensis]